METIPVDLLVIVGRGGSLDCSPPSGFMASPHFNGRFSHWIMVGDVRRGTLGT